MKKILLTIILGMFLLSFISATNVSIQYGRNESNGGIIPFLLDSMGRQRMDIDFANFTGQSATFNNITVTSNANIENLFTSWIDGFNLTDESKWWYNQTYSGSTYNATYDALNSTYGNNWYNHTLSIETLYGKWFYNQTTPFTNWLSSFVYNYNQTTPFTNWLSSFVYNYNQTTPAQSYADNNFAHLRNGNNINGTQDFNGGWTSGGLSIIGGDLFAQTGYFYNITSLAISELLINGSLIPNMFDNLFDLGSGEFRWRNLFLGGNANITGNITLGGHGDLFANGTSIYYFNGSKYSDLTKGAGGIPEGALVQFNSSCPTGWIDADGDNGTPDLVNITINGQTVLRKQYLGNSSAGSGSFNITGTNWVTQNATAIPYQTSDGIWRMTFNIEGIVSPAQSTSLYLAFSGTTFSFIQACTGSSTGSFPYMAGSNVAGGASTVIIHPESLTPGFYTSCDVELDSKPTWADADSTLKYCMKTSEDTAESNSIWQTIGNVVSLANTTNTLNIDSDVNITGNLNLGNGTLWFNDSAKKYYYFNTTGWNEVGSGNGAGATPENAIMSFNQASCPIGWILANGSNGTPDLRGIFIRGAGTNSIINYANGSDMTSAYGEYQNDSFQNFNRTFTGNALASHDHSFNVNSATANTGTAVGGQSTIARIVGANIWRTSVPNYGLGSGMIVGKSAGTPAGTISSPIIAGTPTGEPRVGAETRPASYSLIYCMKTEEDTAESTSLWQRIGNLIQLNNASNNVNFQNNVTIQGNLTVQGNFVGLKQYTANQSGDSGSFNVTGTGWTTTRAFAIPYQTSDGAWMMKFNIAGTPSVAFRGDYEVFVSGVTFKNLANYHQSISAHSFNADVWVVLARVSFGTGGLKVFHLDATTAGYNFAGDVELESKPTWAD